MDKKTVLAIAISMGIFLIAYLISSVIFPPKPQEQLPIKKQEEKSTVYSETSIKKNVMNITPIDEENEIDMEKKFSFKAYDVLFSTRGGVLKSFKLNEYNDIDGTPIEMVVSRQSGIYPFIIDFGDYSTINDIFIVSYDESTRECKFIKKYKATEDDKELYFTLTKTYSFSDDYLLELTISIESDDKEYLPLNFDNSMYTLKYEPQIGPEVEEIDGRNERRYYIYFSNNKRVDFSSKVSVGDPKEKIIKMATIEKRTDWIAIGGKYFLVIAHPPKDFDIGHIGFSAMHLPKGENGKKRIHYNSGMFFNRPFEKEINIDETFKFYIGPKKKEELSVYRKYNFDKAVEEGFFLIDWLIVLLKGLLKFLYSIVRNWGVAIILMTLIIKLAFFPLTQKGFKATTKMQTLGPKIEELKVKYKDNQQKLNEEMQTLYKKEGINPLSGCLPWIIQLPIFFALYGLLSSHFELRGATFISGWINDLASPETFLKFPGGFRIPILNWDELRILPFVMFGTTLLQQKIAKNPGQQVGQMKILLYALPLVFFVILYNMPAGLVLYWTMQNIFSVLQQIYINYTQKKAKSGIEKKNVKRG